MDYVAVGGVIVAIVAGAVGIPLALKQFRLSRNLERVKVYDAIMKYLNAVSQIGQAPNEVLNDFHEATGEKRVKLLFHNEDVRAYVALLRKKANDLRTLTALKSSIGDGEKKSSVTLKWLTLVEWMEEQRSSELEKRLGQYL